VKNLSIQAFRCSSWLVVGFALGACGDDPSMENPALGAGAGGSVAAAGGGAGTLAPAGTGGGSGTGVAGTSGGAGRAAAGAPAAGSPAAGAPAAGSGMMPMAGGAAGAAAGASGGAAGAAAGSGGSAAAGSGGGGAGGAAGSMAGAGGSGGGATFTQVYGLIMMGCNCHVTGSSGGLAMPNKATAYTNLVGANSMACSGQKRVVASDPANSVLFHSVDRTNLGSCTVPQMPRGMAKWSAANIDTVKAWIMAGALNN
jgi:hypothetical protein